EAGDILVRLRAITVAPTESAGGVNPTFPNGSVEVDNAYTAEVDFSYFFTDHVAAELILATTRHNISGSGDLSALGDIAETRVLPPTLTFQYHPYPDVQVSPYIGIGLNWTQFYSEDSTSNLNDAIGTTKINLDGSVGISFQLGADYRIDDKWFLNVDVKYIDIDTEATLNTGGLINTVDVDLDPFVAGFGIGRRF
ncbi:MAG: OmpW family outer membrane protein, partial [Pseudomonadota bacterium]